LGSRATRLQGRALLPSALAEAERVGYSRNMAAQPKPQGRSRSASIEDAAEADSPLALLAAAAVLTLMGAALLARNWAGWTDPLVDFGRELYVPWQLSEGAVLGRDIAYLDGPFSPYFNALCFRILPVALRSLEAVNLLIAAAFALALFDLLRRASNATGAVAGVALFVGGFAFNLFGTGGNMNWVTPYSHGLTHGIALSSFALCCAARYAEQGSRAMLFAASLCLGAAALTKPEVLAASAPALALGAVLGARLPSARTRGADALLFAAGFCACLCAAFALLWLQVPATEAFATTLGGWAHLANSSVAELPFYRWIPRIETPLETLAAMLTASAFWLLGLAPALVAAFALREQAGALKLLRYALPVALLCLTPVVVQWVWVADLFLALPLLLAALVATSARSLQRRDPGTAKAAGVLVFALFSLLLLAKVALKPILVGYAFALAAPGASLFAAYLVALLPAWVTRRGGDGDLLRNTGAALLTMVLVLSWWQSEGIRSGKIVEVASGGDRILADPMRRAETAAALEAWVRTDLPPDASLLVLPEGVIVNYLTRRVSPVPHLKFLPPEIAIYGEARMLEDLRENAPDAIALVQRDTLEYGLPLFGRDYGQSVMKWLRANYRLAVRHGAEPLHPNRLRDQRSGFEVWLARDSAEKRISKTSTTP